jgi:hypothetical protein
MMKYFVLFIASGIWLISNCISQNPNIEWSRSYGGTLNEGGGKFRRTADEGYIMLGSTSSNNGDVTSQKGAEDAWLVKMDYNGEIQWQKSYGGTNYDGAVTIDYTNDGGYIFAGYTWSNDGDVQGHLPGWNADYWVVKVDSIGNLQWQKCLGGTMNDYATSILQTNDGGFMVAGLSSSADGNVTGHHGDTSKPDIWIVKLDSTGEIQWNKSYGGTEDEQVVEIIQLPDSGYAFATFTSSSDGDVSFNHGLFFDIWLVQLNPGGDILWEKTYGGSNTDVFGDLIKTQDGGYLLGGVTRSTDGDVTSFIGSKGNAWLVKLDSQGGLQWQKTYVGINNDGGVHHIESTSDKGYVFTGAALPLTLLGQTSFIDSWIVKIDSLGNEKWQMAIGGSNIDDSQTILQTPDGGYIVGGSTFSNDNDVVDNHGQGDLWLVKLSPSSGLEEQNINQKEIGLYPNPASDLLKITGKANEGKLFSMLGEIVSSFVFAKGKAFIDVSEFPPGLYFLKTDKGEVGKVMVVR